MADYNKSEQNGGSEHVVNLLSKRDKDVDRDFPVEMEEEEEEYVRHQWASKREYILSAVGYCVGVGNLWRFPYICIRNGGGKSHIQFRLNTLATMVNVKVTLTDAEGHK